MIEKFLSSVEEIVKKMWTEESPSFDGEYYNIKDAFCSPKPVQKPHPPIWVGGESAPAIRRAAQLGDGWFPSNHNPTNLLDTPSRYAHGAAQLNEAANKAGRDPAEIHRAYLAFRPVNGKVRRGAHRHSLTGSPEAICDDIGQFSELGIETMVFFVSGTELNEILDGISWLTGDVLPQT